MICEPVFEDPGSLRSLLQRAEITMAAEERVPDLELAIIIEKHRGRALPAAITDYLTKHFRGEIRGVKGPKLQSDLVKEFRAARKLGGTKRSEFSSWSQAPTPDFRQRRAFCGDVARLNGVSFAGSQDARRRANNATRLLRICSTSRAHRACVVAR